MYSVVRPSPPGFVISSSQFNRARAASFDVPHISSEGRRLAQTAGRSGWPKIWQRLSGVSWTQRTPAGLPAGIPGIGVVMDGAMQHAPQPTRQSIFNSYFPVTIILQISNN